MKFIRIQAIGSINSFRQPDFHTYHKTLPLPPKTTVAGMIGSALGISPVEVNDVWLVPERFRVGVIGTSMGKANDLWQIRKYESKQIAKYNKGEEDSPYKTAVIVRELLYESQFYLYLNISEADDFMLVLEALKNPSWALSLGREDELVKILDISEVDLEEREGVAFKNTVLPVELSQLKYSIDISDAIGRELLSEAPRSVNLPLTFTHKKDGQTREAESFGLFTYVGDLAIEPEGEKGYYDPDYEWIFQIF